MPKPKDEELLALLRSPDEAQKNRAFILIWESEDFRRMAFSKWKLDKQREDEVWQDAIVALNLALRHDKFRGDAKISSYLYSTVQNICNAAENKKKKQKTVLVEPTDYLLDQSEGVKTNEEDLNINQDYDALLDQVADLSEERCQQFLKDWAQNIAPEKIAERYGLKDGNAAKKETYRCRQRLTKLLKQKPALYEMLKNHPYLLR